MGTQFMRLNDGWNAEPNAPDPRVTVEHGLLRLHFVLNHLVHGFAAGDIGELTFTGCWRYRLGPTNDEGWYGGQCRFSKLAPGWGEFYEVSGELLADRVSDWRSPGVPLKGAPRHFLFYFRDDTFECDADNWAVRLPLRDR